MCLWSTGPTYVSAMLKSRPALQGERMGRGVFHTRISLEWFQREAKRKTKLETDPI